MILGVVLARGGSRRIPGKNKRLLGGKPLFLWIAEAGKQAGIFDMMMVSSDDLEILRLAEHNGFWAILRPWYLCTDHCPSYPALGHAVDEWMLVPTFGNGPKDGTVVLLEPTSPFASPDDIMGAVNLALVSGKPVVTATEDEDEPNGAVYVATTDWLKTGGHWDRSGPLRYPMPEDRSLDINTPEDWAKAEAMLKRK